MIILERPTGGSGLIGRMSCWVLLQSRYPLYGTIQEIALPEINKEHYVPHIAVNINGYGFVLSSYRGKDRKEEYPGLIETNNIMHDRQFKEPKRLQSIPPVAGVKVLSENPRTTVPDSAPKNAAHQPFFPNTEYYIRHYMKGQYRGTVVGYFVDDILKVGVSVCSDQEQFCKKTGVKNARQRLAQGYGVCFRFNPLYWGAGTKKGHFFIHCSNLMAGLYFTAPDLLPPIKEIY